MSKDRRSKDYEEGVEYFINFALQHCPKQSVIHCPCKRCGNLFHHTPTKVREHLFFNGIDQSYYCDAPNPRVRCLPVNPRNTSGCRVTRRHFRKSGRVSFVRRALPKYSTCIYLCQTVQYNPNMSKTASWAHNTILITIYPNYIQ